METTLETAQSDGLDRVKQINALKSENANYKHQIELLKASEASVSEIGQLTNAKTLKGLHFGEFGVGLTSDPKLLQYQTSQTTAGDHGTAFYEKSEFSQYGRGMSFEAGQSVADFAKKLKDEQTAHEQEVYTLFTIL